MYYVKLQNFTKNTLKNVLFEVYSTQNFVYINCTLIYNSLIMFRCFEILQKLKIY